jgi:hypothetical protein
MQSHFFNMDFVNRKIILLLTIQKKDEKKSGWTRSGLK